MLVKVAVDRILRWATGPKVRMAVGHRHSHHMPVVSKSIVAGVASSIKACPLGQTPTAVGVPVVDAPKVNSTLNRQGHLVVLAMLLGCDYTLGVHGVGIVNGCLG